MFDWDEDDDIFGILWMFGDGELLVDVEEGVLISISHDAVKEKDLLDSHNLHGLSFSVLKTYQKLLLKQ